MTDEPKQQKLEPLSKAVETLIRNEYGRYVVLLNDQMGEIREPNTDYKDFLVNIGPLLSVDDEESNPEVQKLATLSRYIDNPELLKVALRLQGLTALHGVIDNSFTEICGALVPVSAAPEKVTAFKDAANLLFKDRMREVLMPDTTHRKNPQEMIRRLDFEDRVLDAIAELNTGSPQQMSVMLAGEYFRQLISAFDARIRNISGLQAGPGK